MKENRISKLLREEPVVVTGMGHYGATGTNVAALWEAAVKGRVPAVWRTFEMGGGERRFAVCEAPAWQPLEVEFPPAVRKADRCAQLAYLAARQAWEQAQLTGAYEAARVGVAVGSSRGPLGKNIDSLLGLSRKRLPPSWGVDSTIAAVSGALAQAMGLHGPGATISAACASAAFAIAYGAEQILLGHADAVLVGGADAPLLPVVLAQLHSAGVLGWHEEAARTCRPFDRTRNGLCLGEGAAFLVLEAERGAVARGARPLARLAGWAANVGDGGRVGVVEDGADLAWTMRQALATAGVEAAEVDYINAHGTGTQLNDLAEARGVASVLGARAATVPCSSTKPVTGHCFGATPAMEAILAIEAMRQQVIPPTVNCQEADGACAINVQPLTARRGEVRCAMSNSMGFWGYQASLIFAHAEPTGGQSPE